MTIYQEAIKLAHVNNFQECIFNIDKHLPYFNEEGQRIISLGSVAPEG